MILHQCDRCGRWLAVPAAHVCDTIAVGDVVIAPDRRRYSNRSGQRIGIAGVILHDGIVIVDFDDEHMTARPYLSTDLRPLFRRRSTSETPAPDTR